MNGSFKMKVNLNKLKSLQRESPEAFKKGLSAGGLQFLTWCNTGSANESRKPPIRYGVLRGSSSVLINGKLLKVFPQTVKPGGGETTPAITCTSRNITVTWVWNTEYATKMHEWKGNWGKYTKQDGDAGNKWLEKHLDADREDFIKVVVAETKKNMGM